MSVPAHRRHDLFDNVWEKLEPHLPGRKGSWGDIAKDNRLFINAVFWVMRTGAPWRDLPSDYGGWSNTHRRFIRWRDSGAAVIPPKKNRKVPREYDKYIYKARHLVENAFLYLKQWRGIGTRYAKNTASLSCRYPDQVYFFMGFNLMTIPLNYQHVSKEKSGTPIGTESGTRVKFDRSRKFRKSSPTESRTSLEVLCCMLVFPLHRELRGRRVCSGWKAS